MRDTNKSEPPKADEHQTPLLVGVLNGAMVFMAAAWRSSEDPGTGALVLLARGCRERASSP